MEADGTMANEADGTKERYGTELSFIYGRRSVRKFDGRAVENEKIRSLLEAAMAAPSAVAKDPWRFVVVRDPQVLSALEAGLPNGKMLRAAGTAVAVCGDIEAAHAGLLGYLVQDCSAAMENLLLAAHALGLGACWLGVHPREERAAHVKTVLGLPERLVPVAVAAVGYPAETKGPRTRFNPECVRYDRWE